MRSNASLQVVARITRLLGVTAIVGGCTIKGQPVRVHEPDQRPQADQTITDSPETVTPSTVASQWLEKFNNTKDPLKDVLLPIANIVLNPTRVTDPHSLTSRSVTDELMALNQMILQVPAPLRKQAEYLRLLHDYSAVAKIDCPAFRDACTGIKYLKLSAQSEQVLKLAAQNDPDQYFDLLLVALELKNRNWDDELVEMLFQNTSKSLSQLEGQHRDAAISMLSTAFQISANKFATPEQARHFLTKINIWTVLRSLNSKLDTGARQDIFATIAKGHFMYADDGSIQSEFRALIDTQSNSSTGILAHQKMLAAQENFRPKLLGITPLNQLDELYFILDQVFSGQMKPETGAALFATSHQTLEQLQTAVENYLRTEFAVALNESSITAKDFMTANVATQDLLDYAIRQSPQGRRIWDGFLSRCLPLQNFASLASATRPNFTSAKINMESLFKSLPRSINLASSMPQELILFHILSQKQFKLNLHLYGSLDSAEIYAALFQERIHPLLEFTDDKTTLNQFQILYAFDLGLRSNLYTNLHIDIDKFISDTIRRLSGKTMDEVNLELSAVPSRFRQAPAYIDLKRACEELDGHRSRRVIYFEEMKASPIYGELMEDAYASLNVASGDRAKANGELQKLVMGVYFPDHVFSELTEQGRLDLNTYLQIGTAMRESYRSYLRAIGMTDEDKIAAMTPLTNKALLEFTATRKTILKMAKAWFDDVGDCYWKLAIKNRQAKERAVEMETAYLKQVHADMARLRHGDLSDAEKAAIQSRIHFTGLPSGFPGTDEISADNYVYGQVDLWLRLAKYTSQGLQTPNFGNFPPLDPDVTIEYGHRLDVELDIVRNNRQQPLPWEEDETTFVNTGLRTAFGKESFIEKWQPTEASLLTFWGQYISSLVSLYRLENQDANGTNTLFTADKIWRAHEELMKIGEITDNQRKLMAITGQHQVFVLEPFNGRMGRFDRFTLDVWGMYDFPLRLMQTDELGNTYVVREMGESSGHSFRWTASSIALPYYRTRAKSLRGASVISYNEDLDATLDKAVTSLIQNQLAANETFTAQLLDHLQDPARERPIVDITVDRRITEPMLSEVLIPSYQTKVLNLKRDTGYCFVASDHVCPEFAFAKTHQGP